MGLAVTLVGGPVVAAAGMALGIRYGNLQRYNENYDPETGTVEGDGFTAWLAERVRKESLEPDDPPPKRSGKLVLVVLVTLAPFVLVGAVLALFGAGPLLLAGWAVVTLVGAPLALLVVYKVARYMHGDLD